MQAQPLILSRDLKSTNLTLRLTKIVEVLRDILIINVAAINNKQAYLKIQIIEQVFNNNQFSIEDLLCETEK